MAKNSKTARLQKWVNSDPTAAPSEGQVYALLMPSKGGLNTGDLRATEAAERLAGMGLSCWTRAGLSKMNDVIRRDKARKAKAQEWLTGLLSTKTAPVKVVETPEETVEAPPEVEQPAEMAALQSEMARLKAENARLREEGDKPESVPDGMVYVAGHLRRKR